MVWVITFCSPVAELNRWFGTQKLSGVDRSKQDRSTLTHTHTPAYTTESNSSCSQWYDHEWLKADYKPDSPPVYVLPVFPSPKFHFICYTIGRFQTVKSNVITAWSSRSRVSCKGSWVRLATNNIFFLFFHIRSFCSVMHNTRHHVVVRCLELVIAIWRSVERTCVCTRGRLVTGTV